MCVYPCGFTVQIKCLSIYARICLCTHLLAAMHLMYLNCALVQENSMGSKEGILISENYQI